MVHPSLSTKDLRSVHGRHKDNRTSDNPEIQVAGGGRGGGACRRSSQIIAANFSIFSPFVLAMGREDLQLFFAPHEQSHPPQKGKISSSLPPSLSGLSTPLLLPFIPRREEEAILNFVGSPVHLLANLKYRPKLLPCCFGGGGRDKENSCLFGHGYPATGCVRGKKVECGQRRSFCMRIHGVQNILPT